MRAFKALPLIFSLLLAQLKAAPLAPVVLGYYPAWETGVKPADLNYRLFTHLCHAFVGCDLQGKLQIEGNMPSVELTTRAHAAGVKVLLSLGGANSGKVLNAMSGNQKAADAFVEAVTGMMLQYHYDGIDMDWESPESATDKAHLTAMVRQFRQRFAKQMPQALITMAMPASDWFGKWIDSQGLLPLVDFINVMTYDFHGPWSAIAGPNAALYQASSDTAHSSFSVVQSMDYWTRQKGWPKSKLIVGIPCYGRGFVASRWYSPVKGKSNFGEVPFKNIATMLTQGWVRHWDTETGVPYLNDPKKTELLGYEDQQSAKLKGDWIKKQGMRGIFFWEITEDLVNRDHVIVRTTRDAFLK
jgi:chitinase